MTDARERTRLGFAFGLGAALCWGVFPLYFKLLTGVPLFQIGVARIVWSVVTLGVLLPLTGQLREFAQIWRRPRTLALLAVTASLIAVNWLIFVVCVTSGHVVESSLGYFMLPLANVLLGRVFLRERLSRRQTLACMVAVVGVALFWIAAGREVILSLLLALTFGMYGLCRKVVQAEALTGVAVETTLLLPLAIAYAWWLQQHQALGSVTGLPATTLVLLAGTGIITVLPLALYAGAARRLTMATLGIIFYINPTMQFLLGSVVYREPMSALRLAGCVAIWLALIVYTTDRKTAG